MNTFPLVIASPEDTLFEGEVIALSLRGSDGDLAVMAGHVPFITAVSPGKCRITLADGSTKEGTAESGLLTVSPDGTRLLSGSFHW